MNKRNNCVDFLKLIMAIFIALGHFGLTYISSRIVVTCFFVISGYYLVKSYESGKYDDSFIYSKLRIGRIYLYYICGLLILVVYDLLSACLDGKPIEYVYKICSSILPEVLFVQNIGIYAGGINYPLWQMCTLIIVSHIMFSLLCFDKKLTLNVICPIIAIMGGSYFSNVFGTHDVESWELICSFISAPLLRAFAGISLGMALYNIINSFKERLDNMNTVCISIVTIYAIFYYISNNDNYQAVIAFVLILICSLCDKGILRLFFDRRIFRFAEKLSLSVYISHAVVIKMMNFISYRIEFNELIKNLVFIMILMIYSIVFMILMEKIHKSPRKRVSLRN